MLRCHGDLYLPTITQFPEIARWRRLLTRLRSTAAPQNGSAVFCAAEWDSSRSTQRDPSGLEQCSTAFTPAIHILRRNCLDPRVVGEVHPTTCLIYRILTKIFRSRHLLRESDVPMTAGSRAGYRSP
ncbi:hypothetical protein AB1N83_013784 [Pleurotus pulmonarius]